MSKKPALGKGLDALIPAAPVQDAGGGASFLCPVDRIRSNPSQPRKRFDEGALASLARTIKEQGLLQPLVVRRVGKHYELIAGERRLRAARMAGIKEVPVVVREAGERESLELSLLENIQREDLNPIEEARAYKQMLDTLGITQEELARRVGKDRSSIANAIRLLQLPREIQEDLSRGSLTAGHARALLAVDKEILQIKMWSMVKEKGLSVRDAERYVHRLKQGGAKPGRAGERIDPNMQALEDELSRFFGAPVKIRTGRKKGGKIQIMFSSPEELNRICGLIVQQ